MVLKAVFANTEPDRYGTLPTFTPDVLVKIAEIAGEPKLWRDAPLIDNRPARSIKDLLGCIRNVVYDEEHQEVYGEVELLPGKEITEDGRPVGSYVLKGGPWSSNNVPSPDDFIELRCILVTKTPAKPGVRFEEAP